ncbi:MAG TPA: PTS sugar transporter subunit IIA [Gammaproteobacteria bacterium]|nr:PTS sugar transporter subunit IIA [Gammaproteobacteria bacterium]
MNLATLTSPEAIICTEEISSKKRAVEKLAGLLADVNPQLNHDQIFDALMERERLGTTALGKGVAIPHCRLADMEQASIALVKIDTGINYDAPDGLPVDILFALVVPEESTEEHLEILATLAELLSDSQFLARLRDQHEAASLYQYLSDTAERFAQQEHAAATPVISAQQAS